MDSAGSPLHLVLGVTPSPFILGQGTPMGVRLKWCVLRLFTFSHSGLESSLLEGGSCIFGSGFPQIITCTSPKWGSPSTGCGEGGSPIPGRRFSYMQFAIFSLGTRWPCPTIACGLPAAGLFPNTYLPCSILCFCAEAASLVEGWCFAFSCQICPTNKMLYDDGRIMIKNHGQLSNAQIIALQVLRYNFLCTKENYKPHSSDNNKSCEISSQWPAVLWLHNRSA